MFAMTTRPRNDEKLQKSKRSRGSPRAPAAVNVEPISVHASRVDTVRYAGVGPTGVPIAAAKARANSANIHTLVGSVTGPVGIGGATVVGIACGIYSQ